MVQKNDSNKKPIVNSKDKNNSDWNFELDTKSLDAANTRAEVDEEAPKKRPTKLAVESQKVNTAKSRMSLYKELEERDRVDTEDVIVHASIVKRAIGLIIDLVFDVGLVFVALQLVPVTRFIISLPMDKYGFVWHFNAATMNNVYWGVNIFIALCLGIWMPTLFYNTTMGKRVMNLRVRDMGQYTLSPYQAFTRELIFKPISICTAFGFIVPLFNKERRSFHDFLAKTQVIND